MSPDALLAIEAPLRLGSFLLVLALCELWQGWRPLRGDGRQWRRQLRNLGLVALGTLLVRALFPLLAVQWALQCQAQGLGLFANSNLPPVLLIGLSVLALDLVIYAQHRLFHQVPWLWRLHRVHHSDTGFDVSTGVRFHPLEFILSMLIKFAAIALLGAPALAVLIFELMLSLGALFTHSDAALPSTFDRRLRWLLVTPSMHRIHHSTEQDETDSNFGFHLSLWDRCFGSYRAQPRADEASMPIGLHAFRSPSAQQLPRLLLQPFSRSKGIEHA